MRPRVFTRLIFVAVVATLLIGGTLNVILRMPGESFKQTPEPLTEEQGVWKQRLRGHVEVLGGRIGERNPWTPDHYDRARDYITDQFAEMGYGINRVSYETRGRTFHNIEVKLEGTSRSDESVVVGAHYDSVQGSPGANDNGTGVALVLELARLFVDRSPGRTLRFVAFANEEPPFFKSSDMGSYHYAEHLHDRGVDVRAMWSLETLGYYSEEPGSQKYPPLLGWFYPDRGNFVGFVGNLSNRSLVQSTVKTFRNHARIPSEGGAFPSFVPGVSWSDHWSFWQFGFPAVMVTDTAPFRYPYYHGPGDTPDRIDYEALARVQAGLIPVVEAKVTQ